MEQGNFTNMWNAQAPSTLSAMELRLLLEGARLEGKLPLTPAEFILEGV